jgi:Flp pilus assembly protein TadD
VRLQPDDAQARNNLGYVLYREGRLAEGEAHLQEAVRLRPDYPEARLHLGYVLQEQRKTQEAIQRYREVMQLKPLWPQSYHRLAWILATHPSPTFRDGKTAVQLAEKAVQLAARPESLDALAAAYAETGRFAEAVHVAQKALELAASSAEQDLAAGIRGRLALYRANRPFHEPSQGS